jgi:hypothetical protein
LTGNFTRCSPGGAAASGLYRTTGQLGESLGKPRRLGIAALAGEPCIAPNVGNQERQLDPDRPNPP